MRVAIQGEPGSNSHLAVQEMVGNAELVPCSLSVEVFERLAEGAANAAVLPIENSLHGAVADHYDLLLNHQVRIVGERSLRIRHALIAATNVPIEQIERVLSHPVALSQCRRFFLAHPKCRAVPAYDTAGSVKLVLASGNPAEAAIAAPYAAEVYGGTILRRDLEDDPQNFTRFLLLVPTAAAPLDTLAAEQPVKASLAFSIAHRPGSLVYALSLLAEHGADLTRIESRPVPGRPWEYVFFVDLRMQSLAGLDAVLQSLSRECHFVKELGRYTESVTVETTAAEPARV
ncbi:prephenate dehydratase [Terriglobus aquaticus]|uniref:Prephenate dehydratase n=1 Tax=Terriglobus aquaticus TaxID=940139 RepID=A0ABW9KLB2_9BACT|nr:prephenate dehydratase domain-containing protein [Terriglobus aquaticus]